MFTAFYVLGLSAFIPFLIFNHRSSAVWPMILAPIIAALFAEVLARTVRLARDTTENRVVWLIAAFILLSQGAKLALGLDATDSFTEYLALNALYQIVLVLILAASEKRPVKAAATTPEHAA